MFVWTFVVRASSIVLLSFAIGLFLAIVLDKKRLRFQRLYRSLLVVPYAIPGFLVAARLGGPPERRLRRRQPALPHVHIPWLFDPLRGRRSRCILVSIWLTVPYFFLVSLGALQSIPEELIEAARVDGGGAWQVFRRVTLPLLLVAVAPLLIASFAFNFNNFNNIYLLTGGGPPADDQSVAGRDGHPDQLHVQARVRGGQGQDFGARERGLDLHLLHRRGDLRRRVLADAAHWRTMTMSTSTTDQPSGVATAQAQTPSAAAAAPELQGRLVAPPRRASSRSSSRSSRSCTSSRRRSTPDRRSAARA